MQVEGRIVVETFDYIEIRLDDHAIVGLSKSQVRSIQRAATAAPPDTDAGATRRLGVRDQWFVLVNGEGWPVGWMHSSVTRDDERRTFRTLRQKEPHGPV